MKYLIYPLLCLSALSTALLADVKVNNIFGDNMVLQRDMKVPVWGTASPGEKVTVEFNGQSVNTTANADGTWKVELPPMKASSEPKILNIKGNNSREIKNVLVGDVWFCSGQSNMGFTLDKDTLASTEIPNSANPMLRMLLAEWQSIDTPQDSIKYADRKKGEIWLEAAPETTPNSSAVAYWFGKELQKSTGIPIGIIRSAKGGSPIEAWMSKEVLSSCDGGREDWAKYEEAVKVFPEKNAAYQIELKEWQDKFQAATPEEKKTLKKPNPPQRSQPSLRPFLWIGQTLHSLRDQGCNLVSGGVQRLLADDQCHQLPWPLCRADQFLAQRMGPGKHALPFCGTGTIPAHVTQPRGHDLVACAGCPVQGPLTSEHGDVRYLGLWK